MAASIYATPPPDLSSEDIPLSSDVTNTSSTLSHNSNNNNRNNNNNNNNNNNHTNTNNHHNNNNIIKTNNNNNNNNNTSNTNNNTNNNTINNDSDNNKIRTNYSDNNNIISHSKKFNQANTIENKLNVNTTTTTQNITTTTTPSTQNQTTLSILSSSTTTTTTTTTLSSPTTSPRTTTTTMINNNNEVKLTAIEEHEQQQQQQQLQQQQQQQYDISSSSSSAEENIISRSTINLYGGMMNEETVIRPINNKNNNNNNSNKNNHKSNVNNVLDGGNNSGGTSVNATATAMAAFAAAANAAMQLKWLESINEAAKKRRKQHHPNRLDANSGGENNNGIMNFNDNVDNDNDNDDDEDENDNDDEDNNNTVANMYLEENFQQMFQFKETIEMLKRQQQHQQQQQNQPLQQHQQEQEKHEKENDNELNEEFLNISNEQQQQQQQQQLHKLQFQNVTTTKATTTTTITNNNNLDKPSKQRTTLESVVNHNPYYTYCKKCGENFENDIQLNIHMIQEHNQHHQHHHSHNNNHNNKNGESGGSVGGNGDGGDSSSNCSNEALNVMSSVKVKLEQPDYDDNDNFNGDELLVNGKQLLKLHHQPKQENQQHQQPHSTKLMVNNEQQQQQQQNQSQPQQQQQQWPLGPPIMPGFPFAPEAAAAAAAALSARGYLPLLGVPGFSAHSSMEGLNRPPLRIFNPEAYCDLCNKEFCNKYFLRKHKSNKHGIYDPMGGNGAVHGEIGGSSAMMTDATFSYQLQQQQQHHKLQQQFNSDLQQQQSTDGISSTTSTIKVETAEQQQQPHSSASSSCSSLPSVATATIFCDICSKRFTNNFALWRHRAKAHDQTLLATTTATTTTTTSSIATATTTSSTPSPVEVSTMPLTTTTTTSANTLATITTTTTITSSSASTKPSSIADDHLESSRISTKHGDEMKQPLHFPESSSFRPEFSMEQEEMTFTPQPRQLSPQSQEQAREANFAHDKLKRLGVLDPEAFCEICGKEYCNKYFLRTHKFKRHGLLMPADEAKECEQQLQFKGWPFMGLSGVPQNLNFIMNANENAIAMQRMLAAAAAANSLSGGASQDFNSETPPNKRIKLETEESQDPNNMETEETLKPLSLEADATLQNLQKLQSMIQQLNSDPNMKQAVICRLCGRELEHQYALHAHILNEHNGSGLEAFPSLNSFQQLPLQQASPHNTSLGLELSPSAGSPISNDLRCHQCERDFGSLNEFKQHIREVHLTPSNSLREDFISPERPANTIVSSGSGVTRPPYTITPTSSYCEICNKELCNKYFMKTHMQRMHGIEIENGAQIGGVVCNICNKELCSKYFLRVHKQNTHGIVEEGVPMPQPRQNQNGLSAVALFEAQQQLRHQQQQQQQQQQLQQQQQQQQQQHMENEMHRGLNISPFANEKQELPSEACPLCARRFRTIKLMRAHLLNDHANGSGEKNDSMSRPSSSPTLKIPNGGLLPHMFASDGNKNYKCTVCSFTTVNYTLLYMHELTHTLHQSQDTDMSQKSANENETANESSDLADNEPTNLSTRESTKTPGKIVEPLNSSCMEQKLASLRTTATSPIFPALQELAKQHSKPVSYALPKELSSGNGVDGKVSAPSHQMQAFLLEAAGAGNENSFAGAEDEVSNRFVPAIIYLPVREHCSGPKTVWFRLTPF